MLNSINTVRFGQRRFFMQIDSRIYAVAILGMFLLTATTPARADDAKPAPAKEEAPLVGEVRTETLKGFTYFYSSSRMKFQDLTEKILAMIPDLKKGIADSHASPAGPVILIYHGVTEDHAENRDRIN